MKQYHTHGLNLYYHEYQFARLRYQQPLPYGWTVSSEHHIFFGYFAGNDEYSTSRSRLLADHSPVGRFGPFPVGFRTRVSE